MAATCLCGGCAAPVNPSFPVSLDGARADLKRMESHPHELARPLVVIDGFLGLGIAAVWERNEFSSLTGDRRVIAVSLLDCMSFDDCRAKIVSAVQEAFPSPNADSTAEVDVVGFSMGGLAARYAAVDIPGVRRLRIARLFTISAPHRGAVMADRLPVLHPLQRDMRTGSDLLKLLNATRPGYPIFPYVRLGDPIVGVENAAPPWEDPWWVSCQPLTTPHGCAFFDPRIIDDIARRLRTEEPLARTPAAPPPGAGLS